MKKDIIDIMARGQFIYKRYCAQKTRRALDLDEGSCRSRDRKRPNRVGPLQGLRTLQAVYLRADPASGSEGVMAVIVA